MAQNLMLYLILLGGLKLTDPSANATGTYDFVDTLDLGGTFSLTLKDIFKVLVFMLEINLIIEQKH